MRHVINATVARPPANKVAQLERYEAILAARKATTVAEARKLVSTLHPDHGGAGGDAYQQAMERLKELRRGL